MLKKHLFIITLTCLSLLYGCSFSTQNRSQTPHFNGLIKYAGEGIENVRIMLSLAANDAQCLGAKQHTQTDDTGRFSLDAATENYTYTPLLNYQFDEWTLCASYNGQIYTLYSDNRYGPGNVGGSIYLQCDLAIIPATKACEIRH